MPRSPVSVRHCQYGYPADVDDAVNVITEKNNQLFQIAEDTNLQMTEYRIQTKHAVESMELIEKSATQTQDSITSLMKGINEVSEFASTFLAFICRSKGCP